MDFDVGSARFDSIQCPHAMAITEEIPDKMDRELNIKVINVMFKLSALNASEHEMKTKKGRK